MNWKLQYFKYILRRIRHAFRSDLRYRSVKFRKDFGFMPNLQNPLTFNEKILYRMVNPIHKEKITMLVDKSRVRHFVKIVEKDLLPNLYGEFDSVDEINTINLPKKFVLKCNHDSGSAVVCEDVDFFRMNEAKEKLACHFKMNMYYKSREWQYRDITPKILCEEYIDSRSEVHYGIWPVIFRMHCFSSRVIYIEVEYTDKENHHYTNIYNSKWEIQPVTINRRPNTPLNMPAPIKLNKAILLSEKLSEGIDYCRMDFYITSDRIYFSEYTFSPNNGREIFSPAEWDYIFGQHWNLVR